MFKSGTNRKEAGYGGMTSGQYFVQPERGMPSLDAPTLCHSYGDAVEKTWQPSNAAAPFVVRPGAASGCTTSASDSKRHRGTSVHQT